MNRVLAIALNTFREAVRDRVLYLVAFFAAVVMLSSKAIGWVSVEQDVKIVRDVGLTSLTLFGAMIAVFVGTGLLQREMGGRTIYAILARPVARWEFLLGKYLGLLATVLLSLTAMQLFFLVYLAVITGLSPGSMESPPSAFGWPVFESLLLTDLEMLVVTAIAVLFSAVSTPILSAVFTAFGYAAGQLAWSVALLADMSEKGSPFGAFLLRVMHRLMPNLDLMNIRSSAVHGIAVPLGQVAWTAVYAAAYTGLLLALAAALFERRNLE